MFYYGFIFAGEAFEKLLDTKTFKMKVVGVADHNDAPGAAKEMVDDGVHLIELCGDFGAVWAGKVIEAIDNKVPVGFVTYGAEAIEGLIKLPED
jgi:hypothetical protein